MSYLPYDKYRDVLNYAKKMLAGNPLPFSLPEMTEVEAIVDADERSMIMFERANKLEAELAALKEKYRWRKQSEEPAPDGTDLEVYIPPCQGDGINGFTSTAMLTMFRHGEWKVWPNEYWRPLDLPEEEAKRDD